MPNSIDVDILDPRTLGRKYRMALDSLAIMQEIDDEDP
jgi:hypothetical protein